MRPRPRLVIIGGPNGAGKTTLCERMTAALGLTYLGADQIAAESGLGSTGQDFVDSPEVCIARIRTRVARGGHFVPDDDVRRRFKRSLRNFWHHYRLQGHRWQLHYNGLEGLVETARGEAETIEVLDPAAMRLFERLVESMR